MIAKHFSSNNSNHRTIRFEKNLQKEIAQIIMHDLKDPGINALASVLNVKMSKDYQIAYVKIRIFGSDKKDIVKTLDALRRSVGHIGSLASSRLGLRRSPEIIFKPVKDNEYNSIWLHNSLEDIKA